MQLLDFIPIPVDYMPSDSLGTIPVCKTDLIPSSPKGSKVSELKGSGSHSPSTWLQHDRREAYFLAEFY